MEFFDFEKASAPTQVDASSIDQGPFEASAVEQLLLSETDVFKHHHQSELLISGEPGSDHMNRVGDELAGFGDFSSWIPGMSRPSSPCEYCRTRHLECLVKNEDHTSCLSCIALFRECSFSRQVHITEKEPLLESRGLDTLHRVCENAVTNGALTGTRPLRSLPLRAEDTETTSSNGRRKVHRFSRESVKVLKDWLRSHAHHPYPTDDEKDLLKSQTGLKRSQISNWLANARRRGKVPPIRPGSPSLERALSGAVEIPSASERFMALRDMNPLDRWRHSPPENEPASVVDIAHAVANSAYTTLTPDVSASSGSSWVDQHRNSSAGSSFSVFRASSMTSVDNTRSSGSEFSFGSGFSHQSQQSLGSMDLLKRKDRRRRRQRSVIVQHTDAGEPRIFQCTFCPDSFKTKYDWQRHEKSLHLSLEKWTCAPHGGIVDSNGQRICVYCKAVDPSPDHLDSHNHQDCQDKDVAERTFYRKDHLRQHLRLTHLSQFDDAMESWKAPNLEVKSRCGFCGETCTTWQGRTGHLAAHFRAGARMADWKGDWGFEPAVLGLIENAKPPWPADPESCTQPLGSTAVVPTSPTLITHAQGFGRLISPQEQQYAEVAQPTYEIPQDQLLHPFSSSNDPWSFAQEMEIDRIITGLDIS